MPPPDWTFTLAGSTIDPSANEVRQPDGTVVRLEPKATAVLVVLAAEAGEVVTRETLVETVWPDVLVTEASLTRCVSQLRQALGDDARDPAIIETIPSVGYRLLVRPGGGAPAPPVQAPQRVVLVAAIALLVAGAGVVAAVFASGAVEPVTVEYRVEVEGAIADAVVTTTRADGRDEGEPVAAFPYARTVTLGDPPSGTAQVRLTGRAADAEARVDVVVRRGDTVLARHFATATVSGDAPTPLDVSARADFGE